MTTIPGVSWLTRIGDAGRDKHRRSVGIYRCACGTVKKIADGSVKSGGTMSCGCYQKSGAWKGKLIRAQKEKWASGTRKPNSPESYAKASVAMKKLYAEGRMVATSMTSEQSRARLALRDMEKLTEILRANAKKRIGIPMPPGPTCASPDNVRSKYWQLISPNNVIMEGLNLNHLIRSNSHLFSPDDVAWRNDKCRASNGLRGLLATPKPGKRIPNFWKGWKIGDKMSREEAPEPHPNHTQEEK